ncbi:glycosyltransferase, partial [Candidatus Bathyarchaeota archaeon]|nr:glycosyltransferase [Candidatus Bathyarchaeota archaeon]
MPNSPLVSIVIPCKEIDDYARECMIQCRKLDYNRFEVIVLPDDSPERIDGVRVITTGPVSPGAKRNIGVKNAEGEICAFIDSDAYPRRDWLTKAVEYLGDEKVVAVGGPGITPPGDNMMQRASGYVLSSLLSGNLSSRYRSRGSRESDDIHSCNLVVKKDDIVRVGGWNEHYWPGEDTLMSMALGKNGRRMIEDPNIVVYHHRRPLFIPHLRQVWRFGLHRGFFARRFGGNSLKLTYFAPSLLLLAILVGPILRFVNVYVSGLVLLGLMAYVLLALLTGSVVAAKNREGAAMTFLVWTGIVLTHAAYGTSLLVGIS